MKQDVICPYDINLDDIPHRRLCSRPENPERVDGSVAE